MRAIEKIVTYVYDASESIEDEFSKELEKGWISLEWDCDHRVHLPSIKATVRYVKRKDKTILF